MIAKVDTGRSAGLEVSRVQQWSLTLAATTISTYALDSVATMVGVLLVASELLGGLDHTLVVLFLAGTYVFWGAGLRASLKANWNLLEATGTSTSILSKAAYELTRLRTKSARARKIVCGAGYIVIELAKEAPYYVGAFGVALLSDTVSSNEALIFLGGANLGAAGYEYGLAWATRAFLHRRGAPDYKSPRRLTAPPLLADIR